MLKRTIGLMFLFVLLTIPALAQTELPLGQVVEGELSAEGDEYTFAYSDDQLVLLDLIGTTIEDPTTVTWALLDAEGTVIFEGPLADMVAPVELAAGDYTLRVTGAEGTEGTYSFQLWDVAVPEAVDVVIGEEATGTIETPGATNAFTLTVAEPVLFDLLARNMIDPEGAPVIMEWVLTDESGAAVYEAVLGDSAGLVSLEAGTYTLSVDASEDATGTYSFVVLVPPAADELTLTVGGDAAVGNLASVGASNVFTFEGAAEQTLFIDLTEFALTDPDGSPQVTWVLTDPNGVELFNTFLGDTVVTLTDAGTYTLVVDANDDESGSYTFSMAELPASEVFELNIGDAVLDGSPVNGAGNLEIAGAVDMYTFTPESDQTIFLDFNSSSITDPDGNAVVMWSLSDDSGAILYEEVLGDMAGTLNVTGGVVYTLMVDGNDDETGTYAFTVWQVEAPQTFEIAIGDIVSDDTVGAGSLEAPGAVDVYTFEGAAEQSVRLELVLSNLDDPDGIPTQVTWTLTAPDGEVLYSEPIGDSPAVTLPVDGVYTLTVDANDDELGNYIFAVFNVAVN
ncbi:MAG: hypothetical protein OHK0046_52330 [Anaerolineae bacterium]